MSSRFARAIEKFDAANAADPVTETSAGRSWPRELLYAHRLYDWVLKLCPDASEALRLAARCQHICRWEIPRDQFPSTRAGYLKWRRQLQEFHATKSGELLRQVGYAEDTIARVQALNRKANFPDDPESRVLEDALCLVFLEHQLAGLARRSPEDKVLNALRKSWQKMTPQARETALTLPLEPVARSLIEKAMAPVYRASP